MVGQLGLGQMRGVWRNSLSVARGISHPRHFRLLRLLRDILPDASRTARTQNNKWLGEPRSPQNSEGHKDALTSRVLRYKLLRADVQGGRFICCSRSLRLYPVPAILH